MDGCNKKITPQRYFLIKTIYKASLIFLGYIISYMEWSLIFLLISAATLIWLENCDNSKSNKIKLKAKACSYTKKELFEKIDEIPSWVKFPDRERADWLNQVIEQLWPTVNNYIIRIFRGSIETKIRKKYESFRFENVNFGCNPPQIDGIKVYNSAVTNDSIIIDFDIYYDGNCDVNFSLSGADIGGISNFQLSGEIRLVLKPILLKNPIIGGLQLYFLNTPDISFNLDGLSSIPGLSSLIRRKIEEKITKLIVFPNKITKRFSKNVQNSELKVLEPEGVLRVHVFEAKDLMGKDFTGKSDPYVVLSLGAQECKSNIINQSLHPKWDYWCEFIVIDPLSQHLNFKVFDHDNVNEDDFLGSGNLHIATVIKGETDQWIRLENVKHGSIHLRFTWLTTSSDLSLLNAISAETKLLQVNNLNMAILMIYVEMAQNLPEAKRFVKPNPFFILTIAQSKQKSKVKKHTVDPVWEQGFVFLVPNPNNDSLFMSIIDKQTNTPLAHFSYKIVDLIALPNLEISKTEFPLSNEEAKIIISMQLKILRNDLIETDDEESEPDSDEAFSRQNSMSPESAKSGHFSFPNSPKTVREEEISNVFNSPLQGAKVIPSTSSLGSSSGDYGLGRLELSLNYSEPRQKLLITVHQICNLPLKDTTDNPDPYVKIKLINGHNSPTFRTKIKMNDCNPVFEETFEYLFSKSELQEQTLLATVKTKHFFNNDTMGQVEIHLKYINFNAPYRAWFDLWPKS